MSKWIVSGNVYNNNIHFSDTELVFEVEDRPDYNHKQMRSIAKAVAVEGENEFNKNNDVLQCKLDLRTIQLANWDMPVTYTPKPSRADMENRNQDLIDGIS